MHLVLPAVLIILPLWASENTKGDTASLSLTEAEGPEFREWDQKPLLVLQKPITALALLGG